MEELQRSSPRAAGRLLRNADGDIDDEVARLLALADKADKATEPARYWLPWLLALSGARVGELAQLWGSRIIKVDGIHVRLRRCACVRGPSHVPTQRLPAHGKPF